MFCENRNKTKQNNKVALFILDKIDFKTKAITRDKEGSIYLTAGHLSEETPNTTPKGHVHPYVHCCIIYNSKVMETTWISIKG